MDIFIDYDGSSGFELIELVEIKQFLEEKIAMKVDVTTRDSLHPTLKRDIENTAYRVF